jgi:serine O-acetyltransferase
MNNDLRVNYFSNEREVIELLLMQIKNNFYLNSDDIQILKIIMPNALLKLKFCFQENNDKYYCNSDSNPFFNVYHSGQYAIFLYYVSKIAFNNDRIQLADKVYFLNKILNGCDLFYEINLPDVFFLDHPVGSVMGRASYGKYLVFQQNCTIGGNHDQYPSLGDFVWLFANSMILGDCTIGSNVFVSAGTIVKDEDIPSNSIVFGSSPNLILKNKPDNYFYKSSPFKVHKEYLVNE